jgi:hypothetical protein
MEYPVRLQVDYPEKLSRLTTFFRYILAIPHLFVLYFLGIAAGVIMFLAWFAIIFTGRFPKSFFDFVSWYFQWSTRVSGYTFLLTDKYPPFSGDKAEPPTGSKPAA